MSVCMNYVAWCIFQKYLVLFHILKDCIELGLWWLGMRYKQWGTLGFQGLEFSIRTPVLNLYSFDFLQQLYNYLLIFGELILRKLR